MSQLDDALTRLCLLEKDAFTGTEFEGIIDAQPVASYVQEGLPYWVNDLTGFTIEIESQSIQIIHYLLTMVLTLAPYQSGFEQQSELLANLYVPLITQYFGQRRQLKRTFADPAVDFLYPRGMYILRGRIKKEPRGGIGQLNVILEFDADLPMYQNVDQDVF